MSNKCVGKCANCGSKVYIPLFFYSTVPPQPKCCGCGGTPEENLPILKMVDVPKDEPKLMKDRQMPLPFIPAPLTAREKSEVQEKIEETRELIRKIQETQQQSEQETLQQEKIAGLEKSIDKLERMMIVVAQNLQEIKQRLPAEKEEETVQVSSGSKDVVVEEGFTYPKKVTFGNFE